MKLEKSLFRDPGVLNLPKRLGVPVVPDPDQYLPPKVADVTREVLKGFPHTKRVGNYLLGKTLGEGSFAKVKESLHILTGERVAIKVIDKKKAKEDAYVRKNMRREGKLLQMIRHDHVIKLYEIMETENSYYLVTELCKGGDLMDHICSRKKLEERETKKFIRQIISAVHYLHTAGILHRDLKVENLLLDSNKDIKIIDFGLSNAVRVSHAKEGSIAQEFCVTQCGSPAYAAPELLGNKKYGPKVDIWSIGVNMYAMLTGNLPFTVEPFHIKTLHQKMLNGDMNPLPDNLSKNGRDFLKKLLTPDPEQRISLLDAMHHPWITDSKNRPMEPAPFPNKLNADDLNNNIVKHMSEHLDYRLSETIRMVTSNIPSNATSTYHMFHRKLTRYNAEMRVEGKISATEAQLMSCSRSTQNTSGYASRDDIIDLIPLTTSPGKGHQVKVTGHMVNEGGHQPGASIPEEHKTFVPRKVQSTQESSPVRLLHRQAKTNRQLTFQGLDKPHHSANASLNGNGPQRGEDQMKTERAVLRPSTTREATANGAATQTVDLLTGAGSPKKPEGAVVWVSPQGRRATTNETKISFTDSGNDRYRHGGLVSDLPSIAEKPSSRDGPETAQETTPNSLISTHRSVRETKPSTTYHHHQPHVSDHSPDVTTPTLSSDKHVKFSTAENHFRSPDSEALPGPTVNISNAITNENCDKSEKTQYRHSKLTPHVINGSKTPRAGHFAANTGGKIIARPLVIDVEHYERYARHEGGFFHKGVSHSTTVASQDQHRLPHADNNHSKKLVSLVYPTYNKTIKNQGTRNLMYTRHRFLGNDGGLNVTGEKTGVNVSRAATLHRGHTIDDSKYSSNKADNMSTGTEAEVIPIQVHVQTKRKQTAGQNGETQVTLPVISPPLQTPRTT